MKLYNTGKLILINLALISSASLEAHDKNDLGYEETVSYENGEKVIVKTIHLNIDFEKEYEALKAKWDQREEKRNLREKQHQEAMSRLSDRLKVDNEIYERIEDLLGLRLWTESSVGTLQQRVIAKARRSYPSDEMLMEYSFLFKNYPEDGAGLKSTRRGYALLLLELSKVQREMSLTEIESVIGEPSGRIKVDEAEFIVYNMYPDENHALLLEVEDKKVIEIYFGNRDGSNLKLFELRPQLQK